MPPLLSQNQTDQRVKGGIFKLLNTVKGPSMTAAQYVDQVKTSGEFLEKRLCTMMNTVRGSNQYWYLRRSEVKRMVAEFGSPTFFSCAEYSHNRILAQSKHYSALI